MCRAKKREGDMVRIERVLLILVVACGNQQTTAAAPTASATESAVPVASTAPPTVTASASVTPSATASATPPPAPMKTIGETLANAKTLHVAWRPKLDSNDTKNVEIKTAGAIKQIVDAIGGDQRPLGAGPGYMTTFDLKFVDKDGNPLATVSLFSSATMSDSNKKYGRINVADGTYGGITVAKYADLQQKLAAVGVTLP
jgi:hypothetical protein